jgi:GTPase-activating protein BEM2
VPTLVLGRSPKQKAQLDKQDADRMSAMLDDSRWVLDHPRTVKEEAHKENTFSTPPGQGRRVPRPFSRTIIAQQEKNKRDRQFRDHFSREKKLEQQRLEKQSVTYEKTMALAKGGPLGINKAPKHAKKASNAFFRVVRPLSTAFPFSYNTAVATANRQWSLPELDFTPTSKPSLSINLAAARTKAVSGKARSYVFTVDTEDNGRFYFQAVNRTEMEKWLKAIEKTSTTTAEKRRTYVGPAPPLELLTRSRNLGRHPTAGEVFKSRHHYTHITHQTHLSSVWSRSSIFD